jgi:hypothetical protein
VLVVGPIAGAAGSLERAFALLEPLLENVTRWALRLRLIPVGLRWTAARASDELGPRVVAHAIAPARFCFRHSHSTATSRSES